MGGDADQKRMIEEMLRSEFGPPAPGAAQAATLTSPAVPAAGAPMTPMAPAAAGLEDEEVPGGSIRGVYKKSRLGK
jgi:hypothetical protein